MTRYLEEMEAVATMALDVELARLKMISKEMAGKNEVLHTLAQSRTARIRELQAGSADEDVAFLCGQDALWWAWLERNAAKISQEVAELGIKREDQRLRAKQAFGKRDALRQIQAYEEDVRKRTKDWQHEY